MVALLDEIVVLGGFDEAGRVVDRVEALDPVAGEWRSLPALPVAMHHAQAAVIGDRIYILGFLTTANFTADGRAFVFDAGAWRPIASLPAGKARGGGAAAVQSGRIVVVGGFRALSAVTDVDIYDPSTDAWTAGPPLPRPRDHLGAASVGDRVIAVGGREARIPSHVAETLILENNTWRRASAMPTSRGGFALAAHDGALYAIGGEGDGSMPTGVFAAVERYDVAADAWSVEEAMPDPRHGTGAATVGGMIVVPGGASRQGFAAVASCAIFRP